jgi:hypothetical protein
MQLVLIYTILGREDYIFHFVPLMVNADHRKINYKNYKNSKKHSNKYL